MLVKLLNLKNTLSIVLLCFYNFTHCAELPLGIISLSPHITETIFATDAKKYMIGRDKASDFPNQIKNIPIVADINGLYLEKILNLSTKYKLIVFAWNGGTPAKYKLILNQYKIKVLWLNSNTPLDVINNLQIIANNTNTKLNIYLMQQITSQLEYVLNKYKKQSLINYFYPIWDSPIIILNKNNYTDNLLRYCNAHNVFNSNYSNIINKESILQKKINTVINSDKLGLNNIKEIIQNYHNIFINPDLTFRATPRSILNLSTLCATVNPS